MKRRYGIYCGLNEELSVYTRSLVKDIASRFDVHYTLKQNLQPHFTLKYFFETDNILPLQELTRQFCNDHYKSPIQIGGFGSFPPDVFFLGVKFSALARQTFESYIDLLRKQSWMQWHQFDEPNLHLHVTFAEKCGGKFEAIRDYLIGKEQYFDTWFDNITFLYQSGLEDGIEKWSVDNVFEMK